MAPEFVVVQSKEDYDREIARQNRLVLKVVFWGISSFLFSALFMPLVSLATLVYVFLGFMVLFAYADNTKNLKHKSYIKATFAFLYGFWGIAFMIVGILLYIQKPDLAGVITSTIIGIAFLWLSHRYLKKYTTLIDKVNYYLKNR